MIFSLIGLIGLYTHLEILQISEGVIRAAPSPDSTPQAGTPFAGVDQKHFCISL